MSVTFGQEINFSFLSYKHSMKISVFIFKDINSIFVGREERFLLLYFFVLYCFGDHFYL